MVGLKFAIAACLKPMQVWDFWRPTDRYHGAVAQVLTAWRVAAFDFWQTLVSVVCCLRSVTHAANARWLLRDVFTFMVIIYGVRFGARPSTKFAIKRCWYSAARDHRLMTLASHDNAVFPDDGSRVDSGTACSVAAWRLIRGRREIIVKICGIVVSAVRNYHWHWQYSTISSVQRNWRELIMKQRTWTCRNGLRLDSYRHLARNRMRVFGNVL
jgi:hypothetical protein